MNRRDVMKLAAAAPLITLLPAAVSAAALATQQSPMTRSPGVWYPFYDEIVMWCFYYSRHVPHTGEVTLRPTSNVYVTCVDFSHHWATAGRVMMPEPWPRIKLWGGDELTLHWILGAEIPFSIALARQRSGTTYSYGWHA